MRKGGEEGGTSGLDGTADVIKVGNMFAGVEYTRHRTAQTLGEQKHVHEKSQKPHSRRSYADHKGVSQASRATTLHSRKVTWPCGLELFTTAGGGRMSWMTILQGPPTPRLPLPHIHSKSPLGFLSHNAVFPAYSRQWGSVCNKDSRSLCLGAPRCPLSHPLPTPMFPGSSSAPP